MMLGTAPAAAFSPDGLFHVRETRMLRWIALILILWLAVVVRRKSAPRPVVGGKPATFFSIAWPSRQLVNGRRRCSPPRCRRASLRAVAIGPETHDSS